MVNINIDNIKSVYFVGAGGIGMSALVRISSLKGNWWPVMTVHPVN